MRKSLDFAIAPKFINKFTTPPKCPPPKTTNPKISPTSISQTRISKTQNLLIVFFTVHQSTIKNIARFVKKPKPIFENCNFSLTKIDGCRFQDVIFTNCKILGLDFSKCNQLLLGIEFKDCVISTTIFSEMELKNRLRYRSRYFLSYFPVR
ncbi:MAG: hypothetical protein CVT90_02525 [Candidatus Altiarchaeales archaeon HGW-Altiarchaeales-3]|nr:MAG: hypothetical protein CVT90_02525 [Candidatus Altiarchaeales archaeon HGW-Altiarchaeales-3]